VSASFSSDQCCAYTADDDGDESNSNKLDVHLQWFRKIVRSWTLPRQQLLFHYVTGLKRVPATDQIKVMKAPDGDIRRVTILGNVERTVPIKYDDTPEHILFIPPFDTYEIMEDSLISVIHDCSWVSELSHDFLQTNPEAGSNSRMHHSPLTSRICRWVKCRTPCNRTCSFKDSHTVVKFANSCNVRRGDNDFTNYYLFTFFTFVFIGM